jgi:hypothetical protein
VDTLWGTVQIVALALERRPGRKGGPSRSAARAAGQWTTPPRGRLHLPAAGSPGYRQQSGVLGSRP